MGEQNRPEFETFPKFEFPTGTIPKLAGDSEPQSSPYQPDSIAEISDPQPTWIPEVSHAIISDTQIPHNFYNVTKIPPPRPPKIREHRPWLTTPVAEQPSTATPQTTAHSGRRRRRNAFRVPPQVIKPLSADGEVSLAIRHLRAVDPLLSLPIDSYPPPQFVNNSPPFLALARGILNQQLACKAGASIYARFVSLCGGEDSISADFILGLTSDQLKQIGVSSRKTGSLYDLARKYKLGILSDNAIIQMDDQSLFKMLSMVQGISTWSVHMFMIFGLHRPDVLPATDSAFRKGVQSMFGLNDLPRPSQVEQMCERWRPYRSVGSWYAWQLVNDLKAQSFMGHGCTAIADDRAAA